MFRILYFFGVLGQMRAKIEILKEMGIVFEGTDDYVLGNGVFEFDLEINHNIPTLEFAGGCNFDQEELINMGLSLGIDVEAFKVTNKNSGSWDLNKLITRALVKKSHELTLEVKNRFLLTLPDKTSEIIDMTNKIKKKEIEQCDKILMCEFTTDLIPQTCDFESDKCPSSYICCDRYQRDETKCPDKAYNELVRYLEIERDMGRETKNSYCIHIVSVHKASSRTRRSIAEYWRSGGIINTLTGGYTDQVIDAEKLERQSEDKLLDQRISENRNIMIKMNVQFNDLQMRLNQHVCKMTKSLIENLLYFEANVIFQQTKMQIDRGMHECWEGFLPLSVPIKRLTTICREIMGDNNQACFYPYNLFRCKNTGLWVNHNLIVHRVRVTFVKPVSDFKAIKVHVLPIPLSGSNNQYLELNTHSTIIFKNDKKGLFSFAKCENRRIFSLCEVGSSYEVLNDECLVGILKVNQTIVKEKCSTRVVTGNSCVYKILEGNIILSAHEKVDIYRQITKDIEFTEDRLIKQQSGLFVIENNNVNFNCGLINYQNVKLPKMTISKAKIELNLEITELPIIKTDILSENKISKTFYLHTNNISFVVGVLALSGVIVIIIIKLRYIISIKIKSWELQRLRKEFLGRPELRQRQSRRESYESITLD